MNVGFAKFIDRYLVAATLVLLYPFLLLNKGDKLKEIKSIAIIRIWAIGESVLTLPFIKRLKTKFPDAKLTVICTSKNKIVFENQKFVDHIIELKGANILKYLGKFDLSIDTEPFMNLGTFISMLVGKVKYGYSCKKFSKLYTTKYPYNDKIHAADNFLILGSNLNIDSSKILELEKLNYNVNKEFNINKPLIGICITPGPTASSRKWPIDKWIKLCSLIIKKYNPTIVLVSGQADKEEIEEFKLRLDYEKVIDTTNLKLGESIALISKLDLMISLDTGPLHISAAQGVPTIGLFCPNSPIRFGPLGVKNRFVYKPVLENPCINVHLGQVPECKNHNHMSKIEVEDVYNEIKKLDLKL